ARSQRTAALATQSSQRVNVMFIALLGVGLVLMLRTRAPEPARALVAVLGLERLGRLLFDVSPEAVSVADADERIVAVNAAFCRVTGYDAAEAVGRALNFNGSGEQDERFFDTVRAEVTASGSWTGEIWRRRKTGEAYAEKVTRVRIDDPDGRCCGYL